MKKSGYDAALAAIVSVSAEERASAYEEMMAGRKRGHWIWWVFPTLAERGGDNFSKCQAPPADLNDAAHVEAYARHPLLRAHLVETFEVATEAFGRHRGAFHVLDEGFGRKIEGAWLDGPVDSFKAFCSATAFAAVAHRIGDRELKKASLKLLATFDGSIVYSADQAGSSGFVEDSAKRRNVLKGFDEPTLQLVGGGSSWQEITSE